MSNSVTTIVAAPKVVTTIVTKGQQGAPGAVNSLTLTGTNITVTGGTVNSGNPNGNIALSIPQSVATTASPTFAGLTTTGPVAIGTSPVVGCGLRLGKPATGAVTTYNVMSEVTIQSDVTNTNYGFLSYPSTQAANFTLNNLFHYTAGQGTFGAGSTVTNQAGFFANSTLTGATNNMGFWGNIPAGTGRYNLYMNGSAVNYLNGNLCIGNVINTTEKLNLLDSGANAVNIRLDNSATTAGFYMGIGTTGTASLSHGDALPITFSTNALERMRIDSVGRVGIATSTPANNLEVVAAGDSAKFRSTTTDSGMLIADTVGTVRVGTRSGNFIVDTGSIERVRIDTAGNVGVGFTPLASTTAKLFVGGDVVLAKQNAFLGANLYYSGGWKHVENGTGAAWIYGQTSAVAAALYTTDNNTSGAGASANIHTAIVVNPAGDVGIGMVPTTYGLEVNGTAGFGSGLYTGTNVTTGDCVFEHGANRTGSGNCYIDLHSTAGTDFDARLMRGSGANGFLTLANTGTGDLQISQNAFGAISLLTTATERMRIDSAGNVGIGVVPTVPLHVRKTTDQTQMIVAGLTKGIRFRTTTTDSAIEGVDYTGVGSYQKMSIGGSLIDMTINGTSKLTMNDTTIWLRSVSTEDKRIVIGEGRTGNGNSYIDFTSDSTYNIYGLRIIRTNNGPNAASVITHRGIGDLWMKTEDAGAVVFGTTNTERLRIDSTGNVLVTSPTGLGYGTGSGGTVTQTTSKYTTITLNKPSGQITMHNAALAAGAEVLFLFTNSLMSTSDTVVINIAWGAVNPDNYTVRIAPGNGQARINVKNVGAVSLSEAVIINYAIIKGAAA